VGQVVFRLRKGKTAEIDGGYFGGYVKSANHRENRRDRRLSFNQSGKRRAVVIIRERDGKSLPAGFGVGSACTNMAEEYFSHMRRAEIGHHHHIAGTYLLRYAQEASWREDNRRAANGDQTRTVAALAMKRGPSVDFGGYWQRHVKAA
jgi:ISXO2-like transposase domain